MSRRKADVTDSSLFVQNDMNVLVDWDSTRIAEVLTTETNVGEKVAKEIADEVSSIIKASGLTTVTSSLVREIVDAKLIERGFESEVLKHQLIGFSPTEVGNIITQKNNENSNVPRGPEATNLVIAEAVKKRYYLNSVLDKDVAEAHMRGDIHIHDLGMPDRNYCGGNPIQYVGKYGLDLPTSISSAKPAKNAEVLLEQVVKFSASLQGCFAGAVGWDAVNMAIAPYIVGKSYAEIKQLAQILVFEFAQQAISRGGQSLGYDSPLVLKDTRTDSIRIVPIGRLYEEYAEGLWSDSYTTPSLNKETGVIEWKPVTGVVEHEPASDLHKLSLYGGRDVIVTEDHSLFTIDKSGDIIEATVMDDNDTFLVSEIIPYENPTSRFSTEDAWAIGVMIGDGNVDSCVNPQAKFNTGSEEVAERMFAYLQDKFGYTGKIRQYKKKLFSLSCGRGAGEYFSGIGYGAHNKKIPNGVLTESNEILYALLGGLFDSDGHISRGRLGYSTTSTTLSNQIQFVLNRLGLKYGHRVRNTESNFKRNYPVHEILINSEDSIKIPTLSHTNRSVVGYKTKGTNYSKYDFGMLRHKIRVEEGIPLSQLPNSFRSLSRKIKRTDLEPLKDRLPWLSKYDYVLPYQVKSKERIDSTEKVYDISVKDNENFILANGIIAHNSVFSDLNLYWEIPDHYADVEAIGPGGKGTGKPYKDYLKESQAFVMALFDVYYEGDSKGRPFFFPKANVHITAKMFETEGHEEFLDKICSVASEKGNTYFIIDRGKTARISQCCFDRGQKVLIKDDRGIRLLPIEDVRKRFNAKVFHNGSWVPFKRVVTPRNEKNMYRVTTVNGKSMVVTGDHVFPTLDGDRETTSLNSGDYLLFSTRVLGGKGMTYEQGVWIGAYLGDGSHRQRGITLSLSEEKVSILEESLIKGLIDWGITSKMYILEQKNNTLSANVYSSEFEEIISTYVYGRKSYEKRLNLDVLQYSAEFRQGIIDGLYATDGGNSNRIYSSSAGLIEDIECVFTSLGKITNIDVSDRTDEPVIIRGDVYSRNFPVYCIRWYHDDVYRQKENLFKVRNNSTYFRVESVNRIWDYEDDTVFCFDMENEDEPYFTLPNGIITHNCRLTFDLSNDDLEEAREPWRVRHSAIQNVTINMPRCAIEAEGDYDKFCANLDKNMRLAMKAHVTKKKYLRALLDMGEGGPLAVLTMNHDGEPYFRLDRGKALLGVVGLSETIRVLTGEEFGDTPASAKYGLKILSYMNQKCKEYSKEFGIHTILEQTPAETTAYRFAKMDRAKYPQYECLFKGDHESGGVYYTNSSYVPVESDISPIERIKLEGKTHPLITAGSITHIWVGENKPSPEGIKALVKKVYEHTTCSQFDITPEFTTCLDCDRTTRGLVKKCPHCGSEHVEGITRVTGYMSKIKQWNKGKIAELKDRVRHVVA